MHAVRRMGREMAFKNLGWPGQVCDKFATAKWTVKPLFKIRHADSVMEVRPREWLCCRIIDHKITFKIELHLFYSATVLRPAEQICDRIKNYKNPIFCKFLPPTPQRIKDRRNAIFCNFWGLTKDLVS